MYLLIALVFLVFIVPMYYTSLYNLEKNIYYIKYWNDFIKYQNELDNIFASRDAIKLSFEKTKGINNIIDFSFDKIELRKDKHITDYGVGYFSGEEYQLAEISNTVRFIKFIYNYSIIIDGLGEKDEKDKYFFFTDDYSFVYGTLYLLSFDCGKNKKPLIYTDYKPTPFFSILEKNVLETVFPIRFSETIYTSNLITSYDTLEVKKYSNLGNRFLVSSGICGDTSINDLNKNLKNLNEFLVRFVRFGALFYTMTSKIEFKY